MATTEEARLLNEALFDQLTREPTFTLWQRFHRWLGRSWAGRKLRMIRWWDYRTPEEIAVSEVNDFVRMRMRKDGFFRGIREPIPISNDDLTRTVESDKPRVTRSE